MTVCVVEDKAKGGKMLQYSRSNGRLDVQVVQMKSETIAMQAERGHVKQDQLLAWIH